MPFDTSTYKALVLFMLAAIIYLILLARAANAQVIITEVYPAPATGESEWIELYNASSTSADLAGWTLEDQLTTPSLITQWTTQVIEPGSYLLLELTTAKLNNAADGVTLKNAEGATISAMSYPSSESGQSWSYLTSDWVTGSWELGPPTKNTSNPPPTPSPSPLVSPSPSPTITPSPSPIPTSYPTSSISLAKIMACPETGEPEWIELSNDSSASVNLTGWQLHDASATIKQWSGESIAAHSHLVTELSSSRLNNTGDTLTLEAPDGTIAWEENYTSCTKGEPLVKVNGQWQTPIGSSSASPSPSSSTTSFSTTPLNRLTDDTGYFSSFPASSTSTDSNLSWLPTSYLPQLATSALTASLPTPLAHISAPEPNIPGASSVIMGGVLISSSSTWLLLKKLGFNILSFIK
ncbi:MAG TPA: lamin tail domain-containing protein [Patescibacteria group bacterium]